MLGSCLVILEPFLFHSDNIKTLRHRCSIHSSLTGRGPVKTELGGHPPDPSW